MISHHRRFRPRAGVPIELHVHPGVPHGWERFAFTGSSRIKAGSAAPAGWAWFSGWLPGWFVESWRDWLAPFRSLKPIFRIMV
jgi:hypothetical protein